ncbi:IS21 family transposase [Streptomyces sp. NPDC005065]|uniref:IS21 family transposase n=1 Tax=Streptomyces sp. NPDC005065 TaxID=3154461 RepID=UPI00339E1945
MPVSKVELYAAIRRDAKVEGLSSRALSAKYGVGRRTVAMALESVFPATRKELPTRVSRLDPFKVVIDQILREDLDAPRKQRHTVKRVFDRLIDEHQAKGVSYAMVRAYIAVRAPEIRVEEGREPPQAFIPQTHRPGDEAEVDFGDVWIQLNGVSTKVFLFSLRLSFSGKAAHKIFASCGQEAFLEGHVHALQVLGGVPRSKIRYDNLRAAVSQVLGRTRGRVESERWTAFRSHFSIESFYCNPGIEGAHEKGGVEGQIGWFRRNHLVPVPKVESLAELNAMVEQWDRDDDARRILQRAMTVGEMFAIERPLLIPLPEEDFETGLVSSLRVNRYGQVSVRTNHYSVPVRLIGRMVRVVLHASELVVYENHREVARHERLIAKGGSRLELDHYLEALLRKPGALPGATALDQARSAGKFTPVHDAWWQAACKAHGDAAGTRALIAVLLLHRHMPHEHVVAGIATALRAGAMTADAVALEARKWGESDQGSEPLSEQEARRLRMDAGATVTSLTERRLAALPPDPRPLPSVAAYDQLLRLRRRPADGPA